MTLLLGPPSSGKSTLLKALSGRLRTAGLKYQGEVQPGQAIMPICCCRLLCSCRKSSAVVVTRGAIDASECSPPMVAAGHVQWAAIQRLYGAACFDIHRADGRALGRAHVCTPFTVLITAAYPTSRIALKFGPHTAAASCLCLLTLLLGGEGIHVLREANKL